MNSALHAYVDAALALHRFELSEDARTAVHQNFERSAAIAAAFLDLPLSTEDEMAPVFVPVSAP